MMLPRRHASRGHAAMCRQRVLNRDTGAGHGGATAALHVAVIDARQWRHASQSGRRRNWLRCVACADRRRSASALIAFALFARNGKHAAAHGKHAPAPAPVVPPAAPSTLSIDAH